jgi:hypothetical protein
MATGRSTTCPKSKVVTMRIRLRKRWIAVRGYTYLTSLRPDRRPSLTGKDRGIVHERMLLQLEANQRTEIEDRDCFRDVAVISLTVML